MSFLATATSAAWATPSAPGNIDRALRVTDYRYDLTTRRDICPPPLHDHRRRGAARASNITHTKERGHLASGDDVFRAQGVVTATLRNASFKVKLDTGHELIARASGKMRKGRLIRIIPGDRVEVEVSAYDPTKGRIIWRYR